MEAPSPDSDEARTIRTRIARSRSRSRQFFPSSRNGPESGLSIPLSVWNPHPIGRAHCFGSFAPRGGGLQVRAICPFAGRSPSREVTHDAIWSVLADVGRSLCGRWPLSFAPGRGLGHRDSLTLFPISPAPIATVLLHRQGSARPFVVPELHLLSGNFDLGSSPRSLTSSPACGVRDPHAPLRARNGDTLAYVPPFRDPEWCQVQWPRYQDPVEAMKCASWTVPFMIEWDGVARFWSTYSSSPQVVILRERTWWDPLQGTFCDFRGDRLGGTWVPVLHGFSEHLHMLDHAGVRAVHVMCIDDERDDTSCHNAFLPGPYSHQPPHGWQWHPGMASLQPSSLRTGDVLVPDRSVDGRFDPWTQSIQRFVSLVVAGALVATGRLWGLLILLACVTPGAEAMQQPLAFSFNAFRVGRFPWRENHPAATIASLSTQEDVDTVYLSPFSGPGQVLTLPGTSSVAEWSTALLQQDPAWGASACPVWPTVSAGAMIAVPRPPSLHLVCLHVTTHLEHFAISVPRVTTLAWLVSALRNARALDVLSLRIPPALGQTPGDGQDEIHWRTGDLVVALPPDAFTGLFQTPVFVRAEQLRHCAIWSLDFWLAAKADAVMWQPESRPLLTTVPRSSRWCALDSTFEGVFVDRYPGIWTPVPWIAEDRPHLIQVSSSAHLVHVVVETPDTCFCAAVQAHTERQQLWADLPTLRRPPRVLSIPDAELELGTTLRDGDVVVEPPSAAVRGHPLQWGLLGLLLGLRGPAGFWAGAFLFPLGLSYGTRLDYAAGYHRLWTPFGTLLGPAVGPGHVCPSALRDQLPAWGTFARVVPPVVSTDIEWVPRSPDQALASVVLVSPPAPRVVLLPTRSPSAHLLRTLQTMLPELTTVLAHPAVWRGSQHFTHPTLSLRDGDVVHVKADRWFPMLRAPPSASFPTVVHAASLAFWGLPFAVEQPGMIFAWQPGEICPLCLPTVRGETWDPVGLTFRPTLASFSPDRWIPTQRRDRLGLHLVLDSTRPGWVHLITKGFPPRAVARPRQALPDSTRDGDFDPVAAKAAQSGPTLGVLLVCVCLGWRHLRACSWVPLVYLWFGFFGPSSAVLPRFMQVWKSSSAVLMLWPGVPHRLGTCMLTWMKLPRFMLSCRRIISGDPLGRTYLL